MTQPPFGQPNPDNVPPAGQTPGYPAPGQPPFGQPVPGQPVPGQPAFGEPVPGQPPFGQPIPGQPPFLPPPPPQKKSPVLKIILIVVAVIVVLCIAGVAALAVFGKNELDKVQATVASASAAAEKISIAEPDTLGDRPKLTDEQFTSLADQMKTSLSEYPQAKNSFAAFYGEAAKKDIIGVLATEAVITDPQAELDAAFTSFGESSAVTGRTKVDTGDLGGVAECGSTAQSGVDMAVCGWADGGSVGMALIYFKKASEVTAEFPTLRAEIETKS
ncbi:hypothetical protein [Actinoplanes sp. NPDC051851]|uniref:hypothetical protein n=1 Tax=Actinoplanes sp. NPDC051851 TaxID=3154753 RepID=UPI00341C99D1